jgi:hypothetical protein
MLKRTKEELLTFVAAVYPDSEHLFMFVIAFANPDFHIFSLFPYIQE